MLFPYTELSFNDQAWRRINMRKVAHLIGAEMLHNLYNRHWPRINSLRFRHTVTNFKQGTVESFAPQQEWSYMQRWLSAKFVVLDPVLIREIEAILSPDYTFVHEIMEKVDLAELESITNEELALLLIDIMDYPLGDIYKLNVVQIEYSLNFALHTLLKEYEPNDLDRNELLAQLLAPGALTIAQKEEIAFGVLFAQGLEKNISDPAASDDLLSLIKTHHEVYSPTHCAYGENPPSVQDYVNKYIFMFTQKSAVVTQEEAEVQVAKQLDQSKKMLARLNDDRLTILCELMAKIGVFRDYNKAKLGETVIRRLQLLDEIARRTHSDRRALDYYLMAELTGLLDNGDSVDKDILDDRKENGVRFERNEDVLTKVRPLQTTQADKNSTIIQGICASSGEIEGTIKIVYSKEDIAKVKPGDIMVAIGTDFDLLEIMNISSGIITEEGGLLSHASVVSRELKKPCLIGVSNATKILQDNNRVLLNASAGTVEILRSRP